MSTSNWADCPRCLRRHKAECARLDEERAETLRQAYGEVESATYLEMVNSPIVYPELKQGGLTFREDYEIYGAETGEVTVSYGGSCDVCELSLEFIEKHPIEGL